MARYWMAGGVLQADAKPKPCHKLVMVNLVSTSQRTFFYCSTVESCRSMYHVWMSSRMWFIDSVRCFQTFLDSICQSLTPSFVVLCVARIGAHSDSHRFSSTCHSLGYSRFWVLQVAEYVKFWIFHFCGTQRLHFFRTLRITSYLLYDCLRCCFPHAT